MTALYKIFRPALIIYKKEDHGMYSMVELISLKARNNLVVHLKMDISAFSLLSDEKCMEKMD